MRSLRIQMESGGGYNGFHGDFKRFSKLFADNKRVVVSEPAADVRFACSVWVRHIWSSFAALLGSLPCDRLHRLEWDVATFYPWRADGLTRSPGPEFDEFCRQVARQTSIVSASGYFGDWHQNRDRCPLQDAIFNLPQLRDLDVQGFNGSSSSAASHKFLGLLRSSPLSLQTLYLPDMALDSKTIQLCQEIVIQTGVNFLTIGARDESIPQLEIATQTGVKLVTFGARDESLQGNFVALLTAPTHRIRSIDFSARNESSRLPNDPFPNDTSTLWCREMKVFAGVTPSPDIDFDSVAGLPGIRKLCTPPLHGAAMAELWAALATNRTLLELDATQHVDSLGGDSTSVLGFERALTINTTLRSLMLNVFIDSPLLLHLANALAVNRSLRLLLVESENSESLPSAKPLTDAAIQSLQHTLAHKNRTLSYFSAHECIFGGCVNEWVAALRRNGNVRIMGLDESDHDTKTAELTTPDSIIQATRTNRLARSQWKRLAPLIAFVRANKSHPFRDSLIPLLPTISNFGLDLNLLMPESTTARLPKMDIDAKHLVHPDSFLDTKFARSHF